MRQWINKKLWAVLVPLAMLLAPSGHAADSVLRAVDMTVARGQINRVSIVLDATGLERGAQFSLCFDTNLLNYVSAVRGSDAGDTTFLQNTSKLTNGWLGLFLGINSELAFQAGERHLIEVSFRAVAGIASAVTTISICSTPLTREVVDVPGDPHD